MAAEEGSAPIWLENVEYAALALDASAAQPQITRNFLTLDTWPTCYEDYSGRLVVLKNMKKKSTRRKLAVSWNSPRGWKLLYGTRVEVQYRTRSDQVFKYRAFRELGNTNVILLHVVHEDAITGQRARSNVSGRASVADQPLSPDESESLPADASVCTQQFTTRGPPVMCVDGLDFGQANPYEHPFILTDEASLANCWATNTPMKCETTSPHSPGSVGSAFDAGGWTSMVLNVGCQSNGAGSACAAAGAYTGDMGDSVNSPWPMLSPTLAGMEDACASPMDVDMASPRFGGAAFGQYANAQSYGSELGKPLRGSRTMSSWGDDAYLGYGFGAGAADGRFQR